MITSLLERTPAVDRPDVVIADIARRRFLALLGATGLLAACGEQTEVQPPSQTATRRVTHQFGTFDVPTDPRRLVVLEGRLDLEATLSLGFDPIGVGGNAFDDNGSAVDFLDWNPAGVTRLAGSGIVDIEQIAALHPDLIIGRETDIEDVARELASFAPVLPIDGRAPWQDTLRRLAGWLGRERVAEQVITEYEQQLDELRRRHADRLDAQIALIRPKSDGTINSGRITSTSLQLRTLADLGGRPSEFIEGLPTRNEFDDVEFSAELIGGLDTVDAILLGLSDRDDDILTTNPLWQALPAVQGDRVVTTDDRTNRGGVFAARECIRLLDQLYSTLG